MDEMREGGKMDVTCPHCGAEYSVAAGTNPLSWRCPHCGKKFEEADAGEP
jgi:predicted Zn finger-like uncharacterized protein